MLNKLFQDLRDKKDKYLNAQTGSQFEERIISRLRALGFTSNLKEEIQSEDWKQIRIHTKNKSSNTYLDVPNDQLKKTFIIQPYGSQEFPDLLVFTEKKIVPVEIKFSSGSQSKPMWNSNVPRATAFYIFGSYGMKDLTFFLGGDIISTKHREALYQFFIDMKKSERKIRESMPNFDTTNRGFTPYIRAAFHQKRHTHSVVTSFFAHPDREKFEDKAIELSSHL